MSLKIKSFYLQNNSCTLVFWSFLCENVEFIQFSRICQSWGLLIRSFKHHKLMQNLWKLATLHCIDTVESPCMVKPSCTRLYIQWANSFPWHALGIISSTVCQGKLLTSLIILLLYNHWSVMLLLEQKLSSWGIGTCNYYIDSGEHRYICI